MFELILFLALGEPGDHDRETTATVGVYATLAACDAARWDWWRRDALPEGYGVGWFQIMPGDCEAAASLS